MAGFMTLLCQIYQTTANLWLQVDSVDEKDVVCTAMNAGVLDGLITVFHTERSADSLANLQNDLPILCPEDKAALEVGSAGVAQLQGPGFLVRPAHFCAPSTRPRWRCGVRGGPAGLALPQDWVRLHNDLPVLCPTCWWCGVRVS